MKNEKYLEFNVPVKIKLERVSVENSICDSCDTETLERIRRGDILEYNLDVEVQGRKVEGHGLWLRPDFQNISDELSALNGFNDLNKILSHLILKAHAEGDL
jgi:hypothetical protein